MAAKTKVIGMRVDQETERRLAHFEQVTGVESVTLARNATIAALDYFETHGRISFPLILIEPPGADSEKK